MNKRNGSKKNIKDNNNKNIEIANQRRQNLKNMYVQIKKNIKTSFSREKQKNKLDIINCKKLSDISKKTERGNKNLLYSKKSEESRNNNKGILEKNKDEDIYNCDNDAFFSQTEKNIQLLYNKNYKQLKNKSLKPFVDIKNKYTDREEETINTKINKEKNEIKEEQNNNTNNNNLLVKNKKEIKALNMTNKEQYNDNNKTKQKSFEKRRPKLLINKKLIAKDELIKTKNILEKVKSARLTNNDSHKLNLNLNKEIKSRISSQNLINLKDKDLNLEMINHIKKIKKNKIMKQLTKYGNKNNSMTFNNPKKVILLNDTLIDTINKAKKKYSIVNIYNYPTIRNNIPKNFIFCSTDKKNPENSENNIKNDLSNMNCTCFNFNEMNLNSTLNNNLNGINNQNDNNKIMSNKNLYHNSSYNKSFSQEKIKTNFYSKPVARLKKRIFDSPSDKNNDNSLNDKDDINKNDSLEVNENEKNNNTIKDLLLMIKILNKIINAQKKIIEEYMSKNMELKKDIEIKDKEVKNYKNISLKLMFFIKKEMEFNALSEKNKKKIELENQIIKENKILKELMLLPEIKFKEKNKDNGGGIENNFDIKRKNFYKVNANETGSMTNFYRPSRRAINDEIKENGNNSVNPLYNGELITNQMINKKREKSYENKKKQRDKRN